MSESSQNIKGGFKLLLMAALVGILAVLISYIIAGGGVPIAAMFLVIPFAIAMSALCIARPKQGLFIYFHFSFFVNGLMRFLPDSIPYGLMIDGILVLTLVGTLFNAKRSDIKKLNNPMVWLVVIWAAYTFLQVVNPEARSRVAWFYAVRGVSLYWVLALPMMFIWLRERKDLETFIKIWIGWSLLAAAVGFKQQYIGLWPGEQRWLAEGAFSTHVLMGNLRSFSFYSDAGQFGAAMAHISLFAGIIAMGAPTIWKKLLWFGLAFIFFWGFAVAGSRGPLFVIAGGAFLYLFMVKNFRLLAAGIIVAISAFIFLKYTTIAQGNYQVQRLRSALDPNDASLQVRLDNQKKLRAYLKTRPFGGGIGSGANWGKRFSPGTFLAEVALDSWYVKIWVESGVVGLVLHIVQIILIMYFGFRKVFYLKDPRLRSQCMGLLCGFFGIALASYGNQIFGQSPTGPVLYFSMVFFYLCDKWDTPEKEEEKDPKKEKIVLW